MKVHLYDFRWVDERTTEFQASVGSRFGRKQMRIGEPLSIEIVSDEVFCAGSVTNGVWSPCSEKAKGRAQCDLCKMRERNFVFTAFDGFDRSNVTESDLAQIADPHVVYLALFDRNLIKVGVSKNERHILRQLEQGSDATLFIAKTPDGILARQIETILKKSGFSDKVKPSQKKDFLCPQIPIEEKNSILQESCKNSRKVLEKYENLKKYLLESPEFQTWEEFYHIVAISKSLKSYHSIELQPHEFVSGKIVALKGPFVIIETPDELVSICAKNLMGHEIEFDEKPAGLKIKAAVQKTLF